MEFIKNIRRQAQQEKKRIVLPEAADPRMVKAVAQIVKEDLADIILLGDKEKIEALGRKHEVDLTGVEVINPAEADKLDEYAKIYYQLRKHKEITKKEAKEKIKDPLYFASMMVKQGDADGKVAGAANATGDVLRPAIKIIGTAEGISIISSSFIMIVEDEEFGADGAMVFSDCAVNPAPDSQQLAEIAVSAAETAQNLVNITPKVAMLSFSTNGSAQHELVDKVKEATAKAKELAPELKIDGEMQADAALVPEVADKKYPESELAGDANVLVFPDLQAANIGYKLVQRLAGAEAVGPISQGIAQPVNDLSRGCSVEDIVNVVSITVVQAQNC